MPDEPPARLGLVIVGHPVDHFLVADALVLVRDLVGLGVELEPGVVDLELAAALAGLRRCPLTSPPESPGSAGVLSLGSRDGTPDC